MAIKQKTQKGFTLIELLMVVAIIAILATVILINLDSGRERAEVNRYVSYATQMHRLVADSAAAGQFDSAKGGITANTSYCLGDVDYDCSVNGTIKSLANSGNGDEATVYKALTYLTKMPKTTEENSISPYSTTEGVYMTYKPSGASGVVRVTMAVGTDDGNYVNKLCKRIGWKTTANKKDCYVDVKLHSRL